MFRCAPALLDRALGVHLRTDVSTWAQIGHTSDPVDLPALIAEMHQHLGWDNQRLDSEHGADSSAALQRVQSEPRVEVTLSVGPDARILVFPTAAAVSAAHHGWRPEF